MKGKRMEEDETRGGLGNRTTGQSEGDNRETVGLVGGDRR